MRVSPNFTDKELSKSATANAHHIDNTPDADTVVRLRLLATGVLEPIRNYCGGEQIVVHDAFRCWAVNRLVPGASETSAHPWGCAADIEHESLTLEELFAAIKAMHARGFLPLLDQCILEQACVHVAIAKPGSSPRGQFERRVLTDGRYEYLAA